MGRCFSCIRLRPTAAVVATSLWDVVVVVVVVAIGVEGRGRYMLIDLLLGLNAVDNPIALWWCPIVTIRVIVIVATSNDMEVCERNSIVRLVVDVVQRVVSAIDEISWAPLQWISAKQMQGHVPWSISNAVSNEARRAKGHRIHCSCQRQVGGGLWWWWHAACRRVVVRGDDDDEDSSPTRRHIISPE